MKSFFTCMRGSESRESFIVEEIHACSFLIFDVLGPAPPAMFLSKSRLPRQWWSRIPVSRSGAIWHKRGWTMAEPEIVLPWFKMNNFEHFFLV
jgi:hypothetical protein